VLASLLDQIIHSFVTFLVILDPPGVAVIFAGLLRDADDAFRRHTAFQATLIAGAIVIVFGLFGEAVLDALDVSIPAFRIAGGLLLFLLATDMVFARQSGIRKPTEPEEKEVRRQHDVSVFPLAFPLLAGPGALTSVVLSVGRAHGYIETAAVFASLVAALALTLVALLADCQAPRRDRCKCHRSRARRGARRPCRAICRRRHRRHHPGRTLIYRPRLPIF